MRCNVKSVNPLQDIRAEFERQMEYQHLAAGVRMSVTETDALVQVDFDVPGFSESELDISFENGSVVVSGKRTLVIPDNARTLFSNRGEGVFRRVLKLDKSIDPETINAVLKDGVLTVTLQRRSSIAPRRIAIRNATVSPQSNE